MKVAIKTAHAVKYGAQITTYFVGVLLFTVLPMIGGLVLVYTGLGSPDTVSMAVTSLTTQPNIVLLVVGVLTFLIGLILHMIGVLGGLFKLIADATYYGRKKSFRHTT